MRSLSFTLHAAPGDQLAADAFDHLVGQRVSMPKVAERALIEGVMVAEDGQSVRVSVRLDPGPAPAPRVSRLGGKDDPRYPSPTDGDDLARRETGREDFSAGRGDGGER